MHEWSPGGEGQFVPVSPGHQNGMLETVPDSRIQDFRLSQSAVLSLARHPPAGHLHVLALALAFPSTVCDIATAT